MLSFHQLQTAIIDRSLRYKRNKTLRDAALREKATSGWLKRVPLCVRTRHIAPHHRVRSFVALNSLPIMHFESAGRNRLVFSLSAASFWACSGDPGTRWPPTSAQISPVSFIPSLFPFLSSPLMLSETQDVLKVTRRKTEPCPFEREHN